VLPRRCPSDHQSYHQRQLGSNFHRQQFLRVLRHSKVLELNCRLLLRGDVHLLIHLLLRVHLLIQTRPHRESHHEHQHEQILRQRLSLLPGNV
jgi:hypothetical protein